MNAGRILALAAATLAAALAVPPIAGAAVDLSSYVRVGRFDLPVGSAPNLLASEASSVTYDRATDSLFVVGDEGTAVVQVSRTGQLLSSMGLAAGAFDDTEGIAALGGGQFALVEERLRQIDRFTYVAGGTLTRAQVQSVKLGTTVGNIGIEGITNDPFSGGFVAVKETQPQGIFQTTIDFAAGTASNGSPTTENSANLFDPALLGLNDIADVFSVSNLPAAVSGTDAGHLLVLSQESAKLVNTDRSGVVSNSLSLGEEVGTEGVTMDDTGRLFLVNEAGGGSGRPQLWVYEAGTPAPSVTFQNPVSTLPENTSTATRIKVADIAVAGGGALSLGGADAASFEIANDVLYLKAGTVLTRRTYTVTVSTPNATSAPLVLTITAAPSPVSLAVTEISPWSSGNSPYMADWFEVTNTGSAPVDLTGYKVDDSSNAIATALALNGVPSIAPGQSVVFTEGTAATAAALKAFWEIPNVAVGYYSGAGIGLSTGGDAVNLFDATGARVTGVSFGASTDFVTFDNVAGLKLSAPGINGATTVGGETGGPGTIVTRRIEDAVPATVGGTVAAQLSLVLGAPAVFAPFTAGAAKDYTAATTATVTSTAGGATLSVDGGTLSNGAFALAQPVQIAFSKTSWSAPVSNDVVTIGFTQHIGATDPLRTGTYAKTLTFTLSTTTP